MTTLAGETEPLAGGAVLDLPLWLGAVLVVCGVVVFTFLVLLVVFAVRAWLDAARGPRAERPVGSRRRSVAGRLSALAGFGVMGWSVLFPLLRSHSLLRVPGCGPGSFPTGTCLPMPDLSAVHVHWGYGLIGSGLMVLAGFIAGAPNRTADCEPEADTS